MTARVRFASAAHAFADVVARVPGDCWDRPGLGVWTVRSVVGHTVSVLRDVVSALDRPAESEPITSAAAYYGLARTVNRSVYEHAVAASTTGAVDEGVALGDAPADTVQRLVGQVLTTLEGRGDADLVTSAGGGMRLDVYLQTRTFELATHTVDIAIAVRIDPDIPGDALDEVCALAARLAVLNGDGVTVLRALTGRTDLRGFSVV
jgi:uncharacterized protein (TIGR03083 family)